MRDLIQNVGNVLTIQHQTCVDEIFKCTIFEGYGGVIFFTGVPPYGPDISLRKMVYIRTLLKRKMMIGWISLNQSLLTFKTSHVFGLPDD